MINNNVKKQYPVIRMPNGHPISSTMYNRGDLHGVVYSNDIEFDDVLLSNVITTSTIVANLNVSTTVSSNIVSSGLLLGNVTVSKLVNSTISTSSNVTANAKLAYNLLSSLTTSSSVVGNLTIPKLVSTSLVSTGTIVADLSVSSATSSLLLDTYPSAAAAYSLRKLRTAYTGSAVRVRRSSDNTEQDIGFVSGQLDTESLLAFCGVGNGFVTTWYDQSGNARNATQTTQASQPQIVTTGILFLQGTKPSINLNGTSNSLNMININNIVSSIGHFNSFGVYFNIETVINTIYESLFSNTNVRIRHQYSRILPNRYGIGGRRLVSDNQDYSESTISISNYVLISNIIKFISSDLFVYQNGNNVVSNLNYQTDGLTDAENTNNFAFFSKNLTPFQYFKGNVQEIVIYTTDKSSDRINIETNINTNYAIY